MTYKNIPVRPSTHREVTRRGVKGESYDAIIVRLLRKETEKEKVVDASFEDKIGRHLEE